MPFSVLPQPEEKARYVNRMFAAIAGRYDLMNRLMTFGLDQGWRRYAARAVAGGAEDRANLALDVGTGTGDFLLCLWETMPGALLVGVDFTLEMMVAGRTKLATLGNAAVFTCGDALALPFPDNTFDALTTGFTLRNVVNIPAALRELYRVVRPGGRMACLEVARPRNPLVRLGHRIYFNRVVPIIGTLVAGNKRAYTYLPQSAETFPSPDRLAEMMCEAGWQSVSYRLLSLGAVAVHIGRKV